MYFFRYLRRRPHPNALLTIRLMVLQVVICQQLLSTYNQLIASQSLSSVFAPRASSRMLDYCLVPRNIRTEVILTPLSAELIFLMAAIVSRGQASAVADVVFPTF